MKLDLGTLSMPKRVKCKCNITLHIFNAGFEHNIIKFSHYPQFTTFGSANKHVSNNRTKIKLQLLHIKLTITIIFII